MKTRTLNSEQFCSIQPQVLGFKALNGNPSKQRLKLWDGRSELTQAVLDLEGRPGLEVPANYSVIRLEGVKLKQAGQKWAIIVAGYCLLKPGGLVGGKIQDTPTSPGQVQWQGCRNIEYRLETVMSTQGGIEVLDFLLAVSKPSV